MAQTESLPSRLTRLATDLAPRGWTLVTLAMLVSLVGWLGPPGVTETAALGAASTLAALAIVLRYLAFRGAAALRTLEGEFSRKINLLRDGLIHRERVYFGPPFPAPEWRAEWVEREEAAVS